MLARPLRAIRKTRAAPSTSSSRSCNHRPAAAGHPGILRNPGARWFVPICMAVLFADIRYALRMMRASPGFAAVALAALALGIGANTAIFTVVNSVMLAPLPYSQPDRIVRLGRQYPNGNGYSNSIPKYMSWRRNGVFQAMAIYDQTGPGPEPGLRRPARADQSDPCLAGLFPGVRDFAGSRPPIQRGGRFPGRPSGRHAEPPPLAQPPRRRCANPGARHRSEQAALHSGGCHAASLRIRPARGPLATHASRPQQHESGAFPLRGGAPQSRRLPEPGA